MAMVPMTFEEVVARMKDFSRMVQVAAEHAEEGETVEVRVQPDIVDDIALMVEKVMDAVRLERIEEKIDRLAKTLLVPPPPPVPTHPGDID